MILAESVEIISKEALALLYFLLPGLIAAAIYYSLTAHPKKEAFDRVVQALIFTVIIKAMNITVRKCWWVWWQQRYKGIWTEDKELVWSVINAVILGLIVSVTVNWDLAHRALRKLCITKRTSYPSEWYGAFHRLKRTVILHLKGERRVRGWAVEYPDQSERGHFLLERIIWLDDDGNEYPQSEVEATLIAATDVEMVQFLPAEIKEDLETIKENKQKLNELRKRKKGLSDVEKAKKEDKVEPPD